MSMRHSLPLLMCVSLIGCSSTGGLYIEVFSGENTKGINWLTYNDEGWGWTAGFGFRDFDDPLALSGTDQMNGFQIGLTHRIDENLGATLGLGRYQDWDLFGSDSNTSTLITGIHYRLGDQYLLGLQYFSDDEELVFSIGLDDPFGWIPALFN